MGGLVELGKAVRREREREDFRKKDLNNYPAVHERSEQTILEASSVDALLLVVLGRTKSRGPIADPVRAQPRGLSAMLPEVWATSGWLLSVRSAARRWPHKASCGMRHEWNSEPTPRAPPACFLFLAGSARLGIQQSGSVIRPEIIQQPVVSITRALKAKGTLTVATANR